eukprot:jgi/Pico_ML_1/53186/g3783.t2
MAQARTTAELVRDLPKLRPNPSISLESYWKSTGKLVTQAELFRTVNDEEKLFRTLFRIVSCVS